MAGRVAAVKYSCHASVLQAMQCRLCLVYFWDVQQCGPAGVVGTESFEVKKWVACGFMAWSMDAITEQRATATVLCKLAGACRDYCALTLC
jgi:hypothetical protein